MKNEITIQEALNEAMRREEQSYKFYMQLYDYVKDLGTKALIKELAEEEKSHIEILRNVIEDKKIDEIKLGEKCYIIDLGLTKQIRPEVVTEDMPVDAVLRSSNQGMQKMQENFTTALQKDFEVKYRKLIQTISSRGDVP